MNAIPVLDVLDPEIVERLLKILDENNNLAEGICYARDRSTISAYARPKSASGRPNQVGPSNEVAALVVGDIDDTCPFRDIVVETKQRFLIRVFETCKHFMQLQYSLFFPYGDDGSILIFLCKIRSIRCR